MSNPAGKAIWHRAGWSLVCLLALVYFVARGPMRGFRSPDDFTYNLDSCRCWTFGRNPYLPADLATCSLDDAPVERYVTFPQVNPPATLLLLSPLARLPLGAATIIWELLLLTVSVLACVRLAKVSRGWDLRISSFVLAFAPVHTALSLGQTSMLTCSLIALSLTAEQSWLAGILLGLAACFKWHLAAWFVLLAAWNNWRSFVAATLTCGACMSAAIVRLQAGSIATWLASISSLSAGSGMGSSSSQNLLSYQLLNVDALLPEQWQSRSFIVLLYLVILLLSVAAVIRAKDRWTAIAVTAAASTIVAYHRFYDASILCLAIPALLTLPRKYRWLWICFAVFLVPGQSMAHDWLDSGITGFWSFLLLRHEVIACFLIWAMFTFYALRQRAAKAE